MSITFDWYVTPSPESGGQELYHARPVGQGTVNIEHLIDSIVKATTLTRPDVMATLAAFSEGIINNLAQGRRIHLDGIGYFGVTLQSPQTSTPHKVRASAVKVKGVSFRPDAQLKQALKHMKTEKLSASGLSMQPVHSSKITQEEATIIVSKHFETHKHLTCKDFLSLHNYQFTITTARRWLRKLRDEGVIINIGTRNNPLYVKAAE